MFCEPSGNQLFLSSDSKYTRREPLTERLSLHIRACARVLYYCLSACHKSNSRRNFGGLSAKIIKHDHVVLNAQRVEQVKHSLGHHWRTAEVVLDVLWSVVLLEVGVALLGAMKPRVYIYIRVHLPLDLDGPY